MRGMRSGALAAGLIAAATAACAVTAGAGPASSATAAGGGPASSATAASAAPARPVVLVNCQGKGQVRPAVYDIGCMPSSELVAGLSWTSWSSVAFGSGILKVNDCTPTCAQGRYIGYPILTVLWRAEPWPGHAGQRYFSRLTWIYTGKRPARAPTSQTFVLPSAAQP